MCAFNQFIQCTPHGGGRGRRRSRKMISRRAKASKEWGEGGGDVVGGQNGEFFFVFVFCFFPFGTIVYCRALHGHMSLVYRESLEETRPTQRTIAITIANAKNEASICEFRYTSSFTDDDCAAVTLPRYALCDTFL